MEWALLVTNGELRCYTFIWARCFPTLSLITLTQWTFEIMTRFRCGIMFLRILKVRVSAGRGGLFLERGNCPMAL